MAGDAGGVDGVLLIWWVWLTDLARRRLGIARGRVCEGVAEESQLRGNAGGRGRVA